MKKRCKHDDGPLNLDAILQNGDPAIEEAFIEFYAEEIESSQVLARKLVTAGVDFKTTQDMVSAFATRLAMIHVAHKFRHLLSPVMQARLDRQHPLHTFAATA